MYWFQKLLDGTLKLALACRTAGACLGFLFPLGIGVLLLGCDDLSTRMQLVNQRDSPILVRMESLDRELEPIIVEVAPYSTYYLDSLDLDVDLASYHPYWRGASIQVKDLKSSNILERRREYFWLPDGVLPKIDRKYDITNGDGFFVIKRNGSWVFIITENDVVIYWRPKHYRTGIAIDEE